MKNARPLKGSGVANQDSQDESAVGSEFTQNDEQVIDVDLAIAVGIASTGTTIVAQRDENVVDVDQIVTIDIRWTVSFTFIGDAVAVLILAGTIENVAGIRNTVLVAIHERFEGECVGI